MSFTFIKSIDPRKVSTLSFIPFLRMSDRTPRRPRSGASDFKFVPVNPETVVRDYLFLARNVRKNSDTKDRLFITLTLGNASDDRDSPGTAQVDFLTNTNPEIVGYNTADMKIDRNPFFNTLSDIRNVNTGFITRRMAFSIFNEDAAQGETRDILITFPETAFNAISLSNSSGLDLTSIHFGEVVRKLSGFPMISKVSFDNAERTKKNFYGRSYVSKGGLRLQEMKLDFKNYKNIDDINFIKRFYASDDPLEIWPSGGELYAYPTPGIHPLDFFNVTTSKDFSVKAGMNYQSTVNAVASFTETHRVAL